MKRILIEATILKIGRGGVYELVNNLGIRIGKRAKELREKYGVEFYFLVPDKSYKPFGNDVHYIPVYPLMWLWVRLNIFKISLFHMTHMYSKFKELSNVKKRLLTIHDINFMYEKSGRRKQRAISRLKKKIVLASHINYVSNFCMNDVNNNFNVSEKTRRVIYNGVTDLNKLSVCCSERLRRLPSNYFFHISSLYSNKNVDLLIQMMKYLPDKHLVIGGDWNSERGEKLKQIISDNKLTNVHVIADPTEEEKAWLYANCSAFFFPSTCEGFGLPPIEAMKFGKPCFLSNLTSLPEIGGDAACYWDELTPEAMAQTVKDGMPRLKDDAEVIEKIRINASRFNWEECIEQYINYYLEILELVKVHESQPKETR